MQCPNCGSTAQFKCVLSDYLTSEYTIEKWVCGCGCVVERQMKEQERIVTLPNNTIKWEKGE